MSLNLSGIKLRITFTNVATTISREARMEIYLDSSRWFLCLLFHFPNNKIQQKILQFRIAVVFKHVRHISFWYEMWIMQKILEKVTSKFQEEVPLLWRCSDSYILCLLMYTIYLSSSVCIFWNGIQQSSLITQTEGQQVGILLKYTFYGLIFLSIYDII